jgi:hypothetical protein
MKSALPVILLSVLLAILVPLSGCGTGSSLNGSGKIISKDINVSEFESIDIQGAFEAEIVQSDSFGVTLNIDDNLVNRIVFSLEEKNLKVSIEAPATFFPTRLGLKINMPGIHGLKLSQGAKGSISGFTSLFEFRLDMSDASTLNGYIDAGNSSFSLSGASKLTLKGSAPDLTLYGTGKSTMDLSEFTVHNAKVTFAEGCEAIMKVEIKFDVNLSGASTIYYLGNPTISEGIMSEGSTMKPKS